MQPARGPATGGILGDDMGLGKTVQVSALLGVLFYSQLVHHVLLIVPTSLIDNWKAELSQVVPHTAAAPLQGDTARETRQKD